MAFFVNLQTSENIFVMALIINLQTSENLIKKRKIKIFVVVVPRVSE